jgi:hypothetical protein
MTRKYINSLTITGFADGSCCDSTLWRKCPSLAFPLDPAQNLVIWEPASRYYAYIYIGAQELPGKK